MNRIAMNRIAMSRNAMNRKSNRKLNRKTRGEGTTVSTAVLLAAVGVAKAGSFQGVGVGEFGHSCATKVTANPSDVVGLSFPSVFDYEARGFHAGGIAIRFWENGEGGLSESVGWTSVMVNVARSGNAGCGWTSTGSGFRWLKNAVEPEFLPGLVEASSIIPLAIDHAGNRLAGFAQNAADDIEAFVWNAGDQSPTPLGDLPGGLFASWASDITPDGAVIVGTSDSGGPRPQWFRVAGAGTMEPLPVLGQVHGVSANGAVVTGLDENGLGVAYVNGQVVPAGSFGPILDASDDGTVLVGISSGEAWIRTPARGGEPLATFLASRGIDVPQDWLVLAGAVGVSPCGDVIVGWGVRDDGKGLFFNEGFVVDLGNGPDVNGSGTVDFGDLLAVLGEWGPCPCCPEDVDRNGVVAFPDILRILGNWD